MQSKPARSTRYDESRCVYIIAMHLRRQCKSLCKTRPMGLCASVSFSEDSRDTWRDTLYACLLGLLERELKLPCLTRICLSLVLILSQRAHWTHSKQHTIAVRCVVLLLSVNGNGVATSECSGGGGSWTDDCARLTDMFISRKVVSCIL